MEKELKNFNISEAGRRWLLKALHPADTKIGRVAVPSGSTTSSTTAEIVKEVTITAPAGSTGDWDLLILTPPSDTVAALIYTKPSSRPRWQFSGIGIGFWITGNPLSLGDLSNIIFIGDRTSQILGDSYTVRATFDNPPSGTGPAFRATVPYGVPRIRDAARPLKWRTTASSVTVYPVSSSLYDGGTVVAGTFAAVTSYDESIAYTMHPAPVTTAPFGNQPTTVPGLLAPVVATALLEVPLYTSEMLAVNKGCYVAPARDGVYVTTRLGDLDFVQPGNHDMILEGCYALPMPGTGLIWNGTTPQPAFGDPRWFKDGRYNTTTSHTMCDIVFRAPGIYSSPVNPDQVADQQASTVYGSMMLVAGQSLSFSMSGASTGISDQEITVVALNGLPTLAAYTIKIVSVIERVPEPDSPSFPYVEPAPLFDPAALALYKELKWRMPQGLPASANALGTILTLIGQLARVVVPALVPFLMEHVVAPAAGKLVEWARPKDQSTTAGSAVRSTAMVSGARPVVHIRKDESGPSEVRARTPGKKVLDVRKKKKNKRL